MAIARLINASCQLFWCSKSLKRFVSYWWYICVILKYTTDIIGCRLLKTRPKDYQEFDNNHYIITVWLMITGCYADKSTNEGSDGKIIYKCHLDWRENGPSHKDSWSVRKAYYFPTLITSIDATLRCWLIRQSQQHTASYKSPIFSLTIAINW